jgi:TfuA protein
VPITRGKVGNDLVSRPPLPVVFTGISLAHEEACGLLFADIRPPIKRGDLDELEDARVVAIIDGELDPDLVIRTNEIRLAAARGLDIRGASSVGALRAAELHGKGMAGVGWVYEAFHKRYISGADEIAVIYDPYSYRPLTIPLVNIRFCLDALINNHSVTQEEALNAMTDLKSLPPEHRDRRNVLARLLRIFGKRRMRAALSTFADGDADIKRRDARDLLLSLAANPASKERSIGRDFERGGGRF